MKAFQSTLRETFCPECLFLYLEGFFLAQLCAKRKLLLGYF